MNGSSDHLTPIEKRVIYELGGDLGDGPRPFQELGHRAGLSETEVLEVIRSLDRRGLLRRFGATLRHQKSGFSANAMVAWRAPADRLDEVGRLLAGFDGVTHCYQRRTAPGWDKNLYTMIHALDDEQCRALIRKMAETAGIDDYEVLRSVEEMKKTSMRYFNETR